MLWVADAGRAARNNNSQKYLADFAGERVVKTYSFHSKLAISGGDTGKTFHSLEKI
jgi:hypothetical protein